MLLNESIMRAVATELRELTAVPIVVDPVMVSRAGVPLLDQEAVAVLRSELLPLAQVLTPNRYEAQLLSGLTITSLEDMQAAAQVIQAQGTPVVLVKGGGMPGEWRGVDVWWDGDRLEVLRTECVDTPHTHGTGCSLSAAIAAGLAQGLDFLAAVRQAKHYVTEALRYSLAIGQGQGPIGHFYPLLQLS
jgi:hydroxymethylpyrimidine/phosphomethylpyrimidine kinase